MGGNLLGARQDVVQIVNEQRAPGVDGTVAAFTASWRFSNCTVMASNQIGKKIVKKGAVMIRMMVFLELGLPATMASDSANLARAVLASSSAARKVA